MSFSLIPNLGVGETVQGGAAEDLEGDVVTSHEE